MPAKPQIHTTTATWTLNGKNFIEKQARRKKRKKNGRPSCLACTKQGFALLIS